METEKPVKLTRKGKPDRRVSESGPKNIKRALEKRKEIFEEYNRKKKEADGSEFQIDESDSSSEDESSEEDIFISKKKREPPIQQVIMNEQNNSKTSDRFDKLENIITMMAEQQLKSKPKRKREKKTIIQISQPPKEKKEPKPPTDMEKHLKYKILNF